MPATYRVSDESKGQIAALGEALNLTCSDVRALALSELAGRDGLPGATGHGCVAARPYPDQAQCALAC